MKDNQIIKEALNADFLLMHQNIPVYDITNDKIINENFSPGAIKRGYLSFFEWMKTRYSANSNVKSRRAMLRTFGTDNHNNILKLTRALSLSDQYWLKEKSEDVRFESITPYLHESWVEGDWFSEGSIATLFTNGAATKQWDNSSELRKFNSKKEYDVFRIISEIWPDAFEAQLIPSSRLDGEDLLISNFTSMDVFLEAFDQSAELGPIDNHFDKAIELYGKSAVNLLLLDYLVEHDDRHSGNIGILRCSHTGNRLEKMSPWYDFDWCFSDNVTPLPYSVFTDYPDCVSDFVSKVKFLSESSELVKQYHAAISKRINELDKIRHSSHPNHEAQANKGIAPRANSLRS